SCRFLSQRRTRLSDNPWTVFVVDDNAATANALARLLKAKGYDSRPFASAEDFLSNDDPRNPGCIVLDVGLPGMNGLDLQRTLTGSRGTRPIIFISGRADVPSAVRAMQSGAVDFLIKPVDQATLLAAVTRAQTQDAERRTAQELIDDYRRRL